MVAGLLISLGAIALSSCGGSGGAGGGGTPPSPSFTIVVNPSAPVLAPGTTAALQVSLLTQGGFDSAVSVAITGLPTGISAQPAFLSLSPGGAAQPVQLSAQATVAPGTYGAQFQGTAGGATGTTPITINVGTLESFALVPPASNQIVAQVGISAQLQIQTTVCCPPGLGTYQLNFAASGLPADVTAAFSPNPVAPGSTTTMTVSAAAGAATGQNYPVTVTATPSVSMSSQSLALALDVAPAPGTLPNNRTDFIRTDGTAGSMVYDPGHQLIYASDLEWNRVDIVSPVTKTIVRRVPIPAPQGLDLSLDGSRVYVSSADAVHVCDRHRYPRGCSTMASAERGESVAGPLRHGATFGSVERKCASSREWLFTAVESCRQHCGSGTFASDFPPGLFGAQRRWNKDNRGER